ncbi:MAG: polysaccharide biosynthesis tyrosine autokinase [Stagnimonas sp.]|nr:polysaccharide biosynthesis tyrosine autokinase [Stagnimonas sp.]
MNDQNSNTAMAPHLVQGKAAEEINIRELFDIIWSGKWIVVAVSVFFLLVGIFFVLIAQPIFSATGVVQIEKPQSQLDKSLNELSSLIGAAPAEATAEIAILKSRMILGTISENLKLYIKAEPRYLPVVGKAIVRRRGLLAQPAAPLLGFEQYAWGGESITVTSLDVPRQWQNQALILTATSDGYSLRTAGGARIFDGKVGERSSVTSANGDFAVFVQSLVARVGTEFELTRLAEQTVYAMLDEQLEISEQPRDSGVIQISAEAERPNFAVRLVNEVQDIYLRQNVERRSAQAQSSLEFLKAQLPELKTKVDEAQARLNSYQLAKGSVDVQRETELVLTQAVNLETQRLSLLQQREAALQRFTSQHPVVVTLTEQVRAIEQQQLKVKGQVEALPETQQEVLSLMRDVEVNTQLYTSLLNSAQQLQITKAGTVGNVRIIDSGLPTLRPIKPNKPLVIALCGVLGVFLGVLSVFAIRSLLRGVDRPEDVDRVIGLPTYASIPYSQAQRRIVARLGKKNSTDNLLLAALDPGDLAIEALRGLRTSLHFAMMEASNNVVMITGPIAGLGKSFVSVNLAAVLALTGKRTVVIDADLRRGHLHRYAGISQKAGLSDFVAGTAEEAGIIKKTQLGNLDMIPCGTRPPNPAEILMSERFAQLIEKLSATYDFVVIDTPPSLPVTDAAIVGRMAGTTFVVLKAAEHPMRAIEETVKRLRQGGVQVSGMIFNQVGARMGSYGYGAYGYSYGYSTYGYRSKPTA